MIYYIRHLGFYLIASLFITLNADAKIQYLPFDISKNGVTVIPSQFSYSISRKGGIKIGDLVLNESTFGLEDLEDGLYIRLPKELFEFPVVEIQMGFVGIRMQ